MHAPLIPETVGLVDARLLGLLQDGAVLINTARGKIIDADALLASACSGRIDAVLDVTDPEPLPPDSPLLDLPNVFVTPHVAGAVGNEIARLGELAVGELERLVAGQPSATRHQPSRARETRMTRLVLPDTDRVLSRQTGWSRAHWEALADHLLDSLVPYFSPGASLVELPGRPSRSGTASDALEGFARSFMLAAFRIAGVQGKGCEQLIERYARGVANGANPDHPEAWLRLTPRSQQMVEAAAIAVALHETREWIWDRLDTRAQEHVAEWLGGVQRLHDARQQLAAVPGRE